MSRDKQREQIKYKKRVGNIPALFLLAVCYCLPSQLLVHISAAVHYTDDRHRMVLLLRQIKNKIIAYIEVSQPCRAPRLPGISPIAHGEIIQGADLLHDSPGLAAGSFGLQQGKGNIAVYVPQVLTCLRGIYYPPAHTPKSRRISAAILSDEYPFPESRESIPFCISASNCSLLKLW